METEEAEKAKPFDFVRKPSFWITFLLVCGFLLRANGLNWGLPNELRNQSLHPDETINWMAAQQVDPLRLKLTPGFYNYGTLFLSSFKVIGSVAAGYSGGLDNENSIEAAWKQAGTEIHAARWLSVLAGTGMIAAVFLMLRRFLSPFGALMGVACVAVSPGLVLHSHYATCDVAAALFLTISLLYATRLVPGIDFPPLMSSRYTLPSEVLGVRKEVLLAGFFAGLSAGEKYMGIIGLIALIAVLAMLKSVRWAKSAAFGVGAAILTFFITTPGILLDSTKFFRDFKYEAMHTSTGHGLVFEGVSNGYIYELGNLSAVFTPMLCLFGFAGIVMAISRKLSWAIALSLFGLAQFFLIGRGEVHFSRYCLTLVPVFAAGVGWLVQFAHENERRIWRWAVGGCFFAVAIALAISMLISGTMMNEDVRDQAARRLKQFAKPDETVGFVSDAWFYSVPTFPDSAAPRSMGIEMRLSAMAKADPKTVQYIPANVAERFNWDARLLTELKPTYVVFSSFEYNDVRRLRGRRDVSEVAQLEASRATEFLKVLGKDYTMTEAYPTNQPDIHDMQYIRPALWIWKRKDAMPATSDSSSTNSNSSEVPASTP